MTIETRLVKFYSTYSLLTPDEKSSPEMVEQANSIKKAIQDALPTDSFHAVFSYGMRLMPEFNDPEWTQQLILAAKKHTQSLPEHEKEELESIFAKFDNNVSL